MFISPSKLKKNKILKNRTLNFETVQRAKGNLVFIPSTSRDAVIATINSGLFRPMQLLASFTARKYKPINRKLVIVDQKDVYSRMRIDTNNRIKKGKVVFNAYNGQNLFYSFFEEYNDTFTSVSKMRSSPIALQSYMFKFLCEKLQSCGDDPDYQKRYVILPVYDYNPKLKQETNVPTKNIEPAVLLLQKLFKDKYPTVDLPNNVDLYIFYNPNAKAMVVVDPKDKNFEKDKNAIYQKILRLNAFNSRGADHDDLLGDEVEDEIPADEISEEDAIENKKEEIKKVVFSKVAKTLHAENALTDYEAASPDEQSLMLSIDSKVDNYLKTDKNLNKTFGDMVKDVEDDTDVKMKAVRYVESRKSATQRLENHAKGLEKETEIIGTLQDLSDGKDVSDADEFKVDIKDFDERIMTSHLSSMDDEYLKKQYMIDLTNVVSAFSNSDYLPLTVESITFDDTSSERDLKKTMSVRYKTDTGKLLSFQIDIPDIVDKRFLFLGGNKKVIKKQMIRLPVVKTKNDRVEICTNFNKMTIERTSGNLSRRNQYLIKTLKSYAGNKAYNIVFGYNAIVNSNKDFINDYEYEELGNNVTLIESQKYKMIFNRHTINEEIKLLDMPENYFSDVKRSRTPFALEKKQDNIAAVIFIDNASKLVYRYDLTSKTVAKISDNMFEFIADELHLDRNKLPSVGKSFIYTYVRFMAVDYPMFAVIGSQIGLTQTLKRYNLKYRFSTKKLPRSPEWVEVKFKDKFMYYEDSIRATLLLNALSLMSTEDFNYQDFDTEDPYTKYFMKKFGASLGMHVKNTLKINLNVVVDPITKDVLKDQKMPTDIIDLLLYSNSLLVGNQYKPLYNATNYRIRSNEIICDCLYGVLADAYIEYQKHTLNGRPQNLKIDRRQLIKDLLGQENINDKSTLNPTIECEQIAQSSAKGYKGTNLNSAFTLEMRTYDESMNGFLSANATPYSGQAGITRSLTYDPKITSVRGYIPDLEGQELSATNMLSPTELLASFTSAGADSPRQA